MLMWICAILLNLNKTLNPELFIYFPLRLSTTILLYWVGYQGFYYYSVMSERVVLRKAIAAEEKSSAHMDSVNENQESQFLLIKEYIKQNKRFLDPTFSLECLSSEMGISTSKLSQLIHKNSNCHFSDYINSLRVEKAKKYLIKSDYTSYTIVAIGLECGFNSKSAFYAAFKKFTNLTPSEFIKSNA
jgi:YesN/AraC family two-component response regulator